MPQINRQRPVTITATPDLTTRPQATDNGQTQAKRGLGIKLNVYGRSKTGKTRLVCSFPKPMLLLGTEDGTKSVATGKRERSKSHSGNPLYALTLLGKETGIDFLRINSGVHFEEALALLGKGRYLSTALDHGGGFLNIGVKEYLGLEEVPMTKQAAGVTDYRVWGAINMAVIEKLSKYLDLADRLGTNVCIIAHERNFKEEEAKQSDIIKPVVGSALTPGVKTWLDGACDYICQTLISPQENVVKVDVGAGELQEVRQPTGKYEYRLRIGPHDICTTGFRTIGDELPDYIVNPSYEKIVAAIEGR